jgi:hypothetical protein
MRTAATTAVMSAEWLVIRRLLLLVCLTLLVCSAANLRAQTTSATINGQVTDVQGKIVPNAAVQAVNIDTDVVYPGETNNSGIYVVAGVPPGRYRLVVRKDGFKEINKTDIVLHVQDTLEQNFALEVGSVSESVTVSGESVNMDTADGTVSTVVDRQFVENMPLNGRSFQSLIDLTPGVVLTPTNYDEQGQFSINGQRPSANYFTVDGTSANVGVTAGSGLTQSAGGALPGLSVSGGTNSLVSIDAMQEFKVLTSSYAPEFGRTPGAQIAIVTRSGTNQFHGTMFDYFRNDALDANNWFADQQGLPKAAERQNDFGGVLGGPIIKDRTFFFFSYEGLRLDQPQTAITEVPSSATREAAPAALQPYLNAFPVANGPDFGNGLAQLAATFSDPSSLDAVSLRIDHALTSKVTLFGRYNYAPSSLSQRDSQNDTSLSSIVDVQSKSQTLTLGSTQIISASASNEFRFNYSRTSAGSAYRLDGFGGAVPLNSTLLFPSYPDGQNGRLVFFIGTGDEVGLIADGGAGASNLQRQINLVDSFSVTIGSHQLKFGIDYRRLSPISGPDSYQQEAVFSGVEGSGGVLSGAPLETAVEATDRVPMLFNNYSFYGEDIWKVTNRLALTYGLRWEVNPAPTGQGGKTLYSLTNIADPASISLAPAGTPVYKTTYDNFAPRLGVAYQLSQKPRKEVVLRGGFGIFYDLGATLLGTLGYPYFRVSDVYGESFPLTSAQSQPPPFSLSLSPGFGETVGTDPDLKLPRTYQWNVAIEQSLGQSQKVTATYIGAVGRDLLRENFVLTPAFDVFDLIENGATSDYNALQLQYVRRLSHNVQALASYTFSHSIDTGSLDEAFGSSNPNLDRGSSDFDVRHAFSTALTYNFPTWSKKQPLNALLRDWSADTIFIARSGLPVDLAAGYNYVGSIIPIRPDVVAGVPFYISDPSAAGGERINPAAFTLPPVDPTTGAFLRQGTLGRNALRWLPMWQMDLSVRRQVSLTERVRLQFKADMFNLFNHPNFGNPDSTLTDALFGRSTAMLGQSLGSGGVDGGFNPLYQVGGPRSIQLALKLLF